MSYQYGLYQGKLQRDKALERVERNAEEAWKESAREAVERLAAIRDEFTTDAVWTMVDRMGLKTHEPRAMGAIMRRAASEGICEATDRTRRSVRPECHCRPIRVWRSLICR